MKPAPLVSIILPTFNRAELLPRALNSVLSQTYPHWELVIWDDGSTDGTAEVVRSSGDPRIRYFWAENRGPAAARNWAAELSSGEYLAFLDSDDEWTAGKLQAQVAAMDRFSEIDLLFGDFVNINLRAHHKSRSFEMNAAAIQLLDVFPLEDGLFLINGRLLESLARENAIATDTVMLRRDIWEKAGGFNEGIRHSEDFELWWRMGLDGRRFAYSTAVYLTRFKPPGSLSSPGTTALQNRVKALDLCVQHALQRGRPELVPLLQPAYRNAYQNMIPLYGGQGDARSMLGAFSRSLTYGFRPGTLRLLGVGLIRLLRRSRPGGG